MYYHIPQFLIIKFSHYHYNKATGGTAMFSTTVINIVIYFLKFHYYSNILYISLFYR